MCLSSGAGLRLGVPGRAGRVRAPWPAPWRAIDRVPRAVYVYNRGLVSTGQWPSGSGPHGRHGGWGLGRRPGLGKHTAKLWGAKAKGACGGCGLWMWPSGGGCQGGVACTATGQSGQTTYHVVVRAHGPGTVQLASMPIGCWAAGSSVFSGGILVLAESEFWSRFLAKFWWM